MNDRGQVLVIFVILLPIILLILAFVVDYGLLSIEKRRVDNTTYDAVEYYLKNIDDVDVEDKTLELINSNLDNVKIDLLENDDYIELTVKSDYKSIYNSFTNSDLIIKYKGLKTSKEIIKG